LVRAEAGTQRERGQESIKHLVEEYEDYDNTFAKEKGEFGTLYSLQVLGSKRALPTIEQVMDGLHLHQVEWVVNNVQNISK